MSLRIPDRSVTLAPSGLSEADPVHRVYVFGGGLMGPVKIGRSIAPDWRLRSVQLCCPNEIHLLFDVACDTHREHVELERSAHEKLKGYRERGEWFGVGPFEARATLRDLSGKIGHTYPKLYELGASGEPVYPPLSYEDARDIRRWKRRRPSPKPTEADKAAALSCYDGTGEIAWAAAIAGVPAKTIREWLASR